MTPELFLWLWTWSSLTLISGSVNPMGKMITDFAQFYNIKRLNIITDNVLSHRFIFDEAIFKTYFATGLSLEQFRDFSTAVAKTGAKSFVLHTFLSNSQSQEDLIVVNELVKSSSSHDIWLIQVSGNFETVVELLEDADLDSNVFLFKFLDQDAIFKEVYNLQKFGPKRILHHGSWSEETGLNLTKKNKYERRRDLTGLHLRTTVESWAPYMRVNETANGDQQISGFLAEVFFSLQSITNFSYSLMRPRDGAWGFENDDNSWTGMVGQIHRNEADISPAGFVVLKERRKVIQYTRTIFFAQGRLFIRNPNNNFNWLAYLTPLFWQVWVMLIILMALMPLVIASSAYLPPKDHHHQEFTLSKSFIFVFGALTFIRRWSVTPETLSTRVIFFMITIIGLLVQFHWKAGIISQLTVYNIRVPFNDLDGVLRSDYRLLIYPAGNLVTEFKNSEDAVWKELWQDHLQEDIKTWPSNYDDLIAMTMQEDYAFLEYLEGPVTLSKEYLECDMVISNKPLIPASYSFILQQNASFAPILNYYLDFLKEKGHFDKMEAYYRIQPQDCGGGKGNPIGINNIISAILIFGLGLATSISLFVLETILMRCFGQSAWRKEAICEDVK